MMEQRPKKRSVVPILGNVVLTFLGLALALGLVEMLMRAFPNQIPPEVRVNPPARRVKALVDETYDLRQSDGDLYHYMQGKITPLTPDQDQVVAHVHMITDENGFRNSPPEKDTYGIVALGDSFTRASGVAIPWPQKLAETTRSDALNLADVGFGPQDELKVLQQYGLKKQPQWVIMAYFEGNDLYDAAAYEQANPFILTRFARYMLEKSIDVGKNDSPGNSHTTVTPSYRYPITVTVDDTDLEVVFFSSYISWLSVSGDVMEISQNYRSVSETILKARDISTAAGSRFLLVYIPSKEHVYLPFINDTETMMSIFDDVPALELDEAGFIQFTNQRATLELFRQHMDDQALLLTDFAAQHKIDFIDLSPAFQEAAETGAELYYSTDTHWNQLGHNLAAEIINEYMREIVPATTSKILGHSR